MISHTVNYNWYRIILFYNVTNILQPSLNRHIYTNQTYIFHTKQHTFILASSFKNEIPLNELKKWSDLVYITKGTIKIIVLSDRENMTTKQIENQTTVVKYLRTFCNVFITIDYLKTNDDLKSLIRSNNDCIVSLMNSKPNFWTKFGLSQSKILKFNFSQATPLIVLHA